MIVPNRADARTELADLLRTNVTAAQSVYRYPKLSFDNETPVLTINDGGSERQRMTHAGIQATFAMDINVFVLQSGEGWTEEQAEDRLAEIEQQIAQVVANHRRHSAWSLLEYEGRTTPRPLAMPRGAVYLWEIVTVLVHIF